MLTRHFINGCPGDKDRSKDNLRILLMDFHDTNDENLKKAGHKSGPGCKCKECLKLRQKEVALMLKINSISENYGLNSKDEVIFISNNY